MTELPPLPNSFIVPDNVYAAYQNLATSGAIGDWDVEVSKHPLGVLFVCADSVDRVAFAADLDRAIRKAAAV